MKVIFLYILSLDTTFYKWRCPAKENGHRNCRATD